jgi:hypothetical protein
MTSPSVSLLMLMAKSETSTIQGQHALVNAVCQPASPRENDFAISITFDAAGDFPDRGMPSDERDTRSGDIPRFHLAENPYGSHLSHGFEFATSPHE